MLAREDPSSSQKYYNQLNRSISLLQDSLNAAVDENKKVQIEDHELGNNILADRRNKLETAAQVNNFNICKGQHNFKWLFLCLLRQNRLRVMTKLCLVFSLLTMMFNFARYLITSNNTSLLRGYCVIRISTSVTYRLYNFLNFNVMFLASTV